VGARRQEGQGAQGALEEGRRQLGAGRPAGNHLGQVQRRRAQRPPGIARLAQKYGFRPVSEGCGEGWTVADELGRAGAYAIVTPRYRRTKSEQVTRDGGSRAFCTERACRSPLPSSKSISLGGIVGRDMMHLPVEAEFAITLVPARPSLANRRTTQKKRRLTRFWFSFEPPHDKTLHNNIGE